MKWNVKILILFSERGTERRVLLLLRLTLSLFISIYRGDENNVLIIVDKMCCLRYYY